MVEVINDRQICTIPSLKKIRSGHFPSIADKRNETVQKEPFPVQYGVRTPFEDVERVMKGTPFVGTAEDVAMQMVRVF